MKAILRLCLFSCAPAFLIPLTSKGGSATWSANPASRQWQKADNWNPARVPRTASDTAVFGLSATTDVALGVPGQGLKHDETFLDKMVFAQGASAYTITMTPDDDYGDFLEIGGAGIINNSKTLQNIVVGPSPNSGRSSELVFDNGATITGNVVVTNKGAIVTEGDGAAGGSTQFSDYSRPGNTTFINEGAIVDGGFGGGTLLQTSGAADRPVFINNPGVVAGAKGGSTLMDDASLGSAIFICSGATIAGAGAGSMMLNDGSLAGTIMVARGGTTAGAEGGQIEIEGGTGYATFTAEGGTAAGADGGAITIAQYQVPYEPQTIIAAQAGANGGAGGTILIDVSTGQSLSQFQVFGNGLLDLTPLIGPGATIGSLAGTGMVNLAGHNLSIGNNSFDTVFSGMIEGHGTLVKIGSGSLTLRGASSNSGNVVVTAGTLLVENPGGSGTGAAAVNVHAGLLGGGGTITGPVIVGTGGGAGAILAPSGGAALPVTLTIGKSLTLDTDATYSCTLQANKKKSANGEVVANGVTIASGAQFNLVAKVQGKLKAGTSFTVLSNSASAPIIGTFANLDDGATLTVGNTKLQASYEGGNGNDLTLTVTP